jgi:hypothetical protein
MHVLSVQSDMFAKNAIPRLGVRSVLYASSAALLLRCKYDATPALDDMFDDEDAYEASYRAAAWAMMGFVLLAATTFVTVCYALLSFWW